jgi:sugar phosphate permease
MVDLDIGQTKIGLLGSLVYVGLTIGSVVSGWIFDKVNPKHVISIALICNIGAIVVFPLVSHFYLLALS